MTADLVRQARGAGALRRRPAPARAAGDPGVAGPGARLGPAGARGEHGGARPGLPRRLHGGRQPQRRRHRHDEERDPAPRARARRSRRRRPSSHSLGRRFLDAYAEMERLRLRARELPFARCRRGAQRPAVLARRRRPRRRGAGARPRRRAARPAQRAVGLRLLKTTGSAFTRFARDDATTLPERSDRPLFIHMDVPGATATRPTRSPATRRATSRRAGPRRHLRGLRRVRLASRSSTSCTSSASGCWSASRRSTRSRSRPRTTRTTRCRARPDADRRAYTSAFPA